MVRVCRPGGRIVLCDATASDVFAKAAAFNAMERFRDPSTVEFRTLSFLTNLFHESALPPPSRIFYQLPVELEEVLKTSFPLGDDRDGFREIVRASVDGDKMGVNARKDGEKVRFEYFSVILFATKP